MAASSAWNIELRNGANIGQLVVSAAALEEGADVDSLDAYGSSALHAAARFGYADILQVLLEAGAALDIVDEDGYSPLIRAVESGHAEIVRQLLAAGAQPIVSDTMERAISYGCEPATVLLLASGCELLVVKMDDNVETNAL